MPNVNSSKKRKIAIVIVDRANYGRLKPVMVELKKAPNTEMQIVCAGTMVLERFGSPTRVLEADGFKIDSEIYIELEGSTPTTMAKTVGFAVIEFSSEFQRLKPDIVVIIGDRYEALAAAIAASYMNICIAHIQGGEVSGSIDESARHCITKLSHYHFPSTKRSAEYIIRMGESSDTVFMVGCPSGDLALNSDLKLNDDVFVSHGTGANINPNEPYLLVVFHPITTEFGEAAEQTRKLLAALEDFKIPTVWLWPNIDAGSDHISKTLRAYRQKSDDQWLHFVKNFSPDTYLAVLANAACAIGNSSSFVRDSSFLGTPVVLIGDRQQGREIAENIVAVPVETAEIRSAVKSQIQHGKFTPSTLYGEGDAAQKISEKLQEVQPYAQKRLAY